jgi:hypothetical protein
MATAAEITAGRRNEGDEVATQLAKCGSMQFEYKTYQNAGAGAAINVSMGIESGSGGTSLKKECADRAIRALVTRGFLLPDIQFYFSEAAGVPCVAYMGNRNGNAVYTVFMGPKTGQHNPQVNQMPGLTGGIGQTGPRGVADQQYDGTHRFFGNPKMHAHATCVIVHEIGHVLHDFQSAALFWDFKLSRPPAGGGGGWVNHAMSVSHYATNNPLEMVAETFAGSMCGKTYAGGVGVAYAALGGPTPVAGAAAFP